MQGTLWASQGCLFRTASSQSVRTYTSQLLRWFLIVDMRIIETSNVGWTTICKFRGVCTGLEVWGEHEFLNTTNHMGKTFVQIAAQFCFLELQAHKLSEKINLYSISILPRLSISTCSLLCYFVLLVIIYDDSCDYYWLLQCNFRRYETWMMVTSKEIRTRKKYLLFIERKVFCRK